MAPIGIRTAEDIEDFFQVFNARDWDTLFDKFMTHDCCWAASENTLSGREELISYWTDAHQSIDEQLGHPKHVVVGSASVYLQVGIAMKFIKPGVYLGKSYEAGQIVTLNCADFYELDAEHKIKSGTVFLRPVR